MALTQTQVSELYVAIFNRASEGTGNTFWQAQTDAATAATAMLATDDAQDYFGASLDTDQAFVEHIYLNTLNKTIADDADGIAFWVDALEAGASRGQVVAGLVGAIESYGPDGIRYDPEDTATVASYNQFTNRVEVSNYMAAEVTNVPANYAQSTGFGEDLVVTDDPATVVSAKAAVDVLALDDEEPPAPPVEGETFTLTASTDSGADFTGTDDNDFFDASLSQNPWAGGVSNTLSSADKLDGGAGNDTLNAVLLPEFYGMNADVTTRLDIQPEIAGIETIQLEAKDDIQFGPNADDTVFFDAKDVTGVDKIGSYFSDGDLVIENLTTLTDAGVARNTDAITITMDHTDNFNSDEDASDLTVYFDEDYLISGQDTSGAALVVRLVNAVRNEAGENPIEQFNNIVFSVGGTDVTVDITAIAADPTLDWTTAYDEIVDAINAQLIADGFTTVTAALAPIENAVFSIPVAGFSTGDPAGQYYPILISNTGPEELAGVTIDTAEDASDTDLNNSFQPFDPETVDVPLSVGVELEKVGRDGDGGNLIIGGKDTTGPDTDVDQVDGIDVFNITVLGAEDKPSNLGIITSTNGALDVVNIATDAAAEAAAIVRTNLAASDRDYIAKVNDGVASLTVRGVAVVPENGVPAVPAQAPFGGTLTTLDADDFLGDLLIGTLARASNIDTFTALGGGDVTLNAAYTDATGVNSDTGIDYTVTTGAGDDTIDLDIDGDAVDAKGESMAVVTNAGDDDITVDVGDGVSQATMAELENLSIDSGAGNDEINIMGIGNWDVDAGSGDDTVYVANNGNDDDREAVSEVQTITFGEAGDLDTQGEVTVTFSDGTVVTTAGGNSIATGDTAIVVAAGKVEDQITATAAFGVTAVDNGDGTITLTYGATYDSSNPDVPNATVEGIVTDAVMTSTAEADAAGSSSTFVPAETENITLTFTDSGAGADITYTFGDDLAGGGAATTEVVVTDTDGNGDVTAFEQAEQVAAATYNNWTVVSSNPSLGTVTLEANTAADMDDFTDGVPATIAIAVNNAGIDGTPETGTGGSTETLTVAGGADQAGQLTLQIDVDGSGGYAADGSETFSINVDQGNEVDVAEDVAAGINAISGLSATHAANSNDVVVTYDAIGAAADILDITVTDGAVRSATVVETTKGLEATTTLPATWLVNYMGTDIVDNDDTSGMTAGALDLLFGAQLTVTYSGATTRGESGVIAGAAVANDNGFESTVDIETDDYVGNFKNINDAIMAAIEGDGVNGGASGANVLEELLSVREGNLESLIITSVIDGEFNEADLAITMTAADVGDMTNAQKSGIVAALQELDGDSDATYTDAQIQTRLDAAVEAFTTGSALDNLAMATSDGVTLLAGSPGTTENDSTIELGTDDDVIVLSTNVASNNTLVYEGFENGHDTVVNFTETGAAIDMIDFSSYLNAQTSVSGSVVTAVDYAQTLNMDTTADLDEITIINDFSQDLGDLTITSDDETWAGLTTGNLLAALHNDNTDADDAWGNIQEADLDVASITDLVGETYNHIVMVENDLNDGEYKVFMLVAEDATDNADADFTGAQLIGVVDFGDTLANLADANFA